MNREPKRQAQLDINLDKQSKVSASSIDLITHELVIESFVLHAKGIDRALLQDYLNKLTEKDKGFLADAPKARKKLQSLNDESVPISLSILKGSLSYVAKHDKSGRIFQQVKKHLADLLHSPTDYVEMYQREKGTIAPELRPTIQEVLNGMTNSASEEFLSESIAAYSDMLTMHHQGSTPQEFIEEFLAVQNIFNSSSYKIARVVVERAITDGKIDHALSVLRAYSTASLKEILGIMRHLKHSFHGKKVLQMFFADMFGTEGLLSPEPLLLHLCKVHVIDGRYLEAIDCLKLIIDQGAEHYRIYALDYLAHIYLYNLKRIPHAEEIYRYILSICDHPDVQARSYDGLGDCQRERGYKAIGNGDVVKARKHYTQSSEYFQKSLQLMPSHRHYTARLSQVEATLSNISEQYEAEVLSRSQRYKPKTKELVTSIEDRIEKVIVTDETQPADKEAPTPHNSEVQEMRAYATAPLIMAAHEASSQKVSTVLNKSDDFSERLKDWGVLAQFKTQLASKLGRSVSDMVKYLLKPF